ncbi:MAG TPA: DinB family protein, partial [Candidatus Elarobacter sp.]|nr:DinB family protein [Candidatus Elarobacter sp.]
GNCMNWVLGHLLETYDQMLVLIGQQPVRTEGTLARYARGSSPITDPADALPLQDLVNTWDEACARVDAGLAGFPVERLAERTSLSPTGNPDETIGSLLTTVLFHQAYHAGQLGVLRRVAGKAGAIA